MQQAELAPYWYPRKCSKHWFCKRFSWFLGTSRLLRLSPAPHLVADKCKKHQKTNTFIINLTNAARPPWGPRMGRHKYDHPTLTPKSSQGNHTKHWFSGRILSILLFGIHVAIAPSVPFILKIIKKHWFYNVFDALAGPNIGHQKESQKSKNERHAAWERSGKKKNERHAA